MEGYGFGEYYIPDLTRDLVERAARGEAEALDVLNSIQGIPVNGNRAAQYWHNDHTPITYLLSSVHTIVGQGSYDGIPEVVRILYQNCGIPVCGKGAGKRQPLELCLWYNLVNVAKVLLEETDARYDLSPAGVEEMYHMVVKRESEMLKLFARFKARTFPTSEAYLNGLHGRGASHDIPLFTAIRNNDLESVRTLIDVYGANPNIRDKRGTPATFMLRDGPNRDEIRMLLEANQRAHVLAMSRSPRSSSLLGSVPDNAALLIRDFAGIQPRRSLPHHIHI
jgi:hypothetical protein